MFSFVYRGTEWNIVHRSAHIKNSLNPRWQEEKLDLSVLCGGNLDLPLRLSVYDYESSGKHVPMGSVETSVNGLIEKKSSRLPLKKLGKNAGTIAVHIASVSGVESTKGETSQFDTPSNQKKPAPQPYAPQPSAPQPYAPQPAAPIATPMFQPPAAFVPPPRPPTFLDYINGGCEMQMCVAIDFTGSNGDPRKPGTLHYLSPNGGMNDYEKAISSIGSILADYDTDKKFPVWGKLLF